jgi:hypothetical protein
MTDSFRHGTFSGYNRHRCRCVECTRVQVDYVTEWRKRKASEPLPPWAVHGQVNTYANYSCRCELCRAAYSTYRKQRRATAGVR